jgi:mannose-1-phosphate guanylyltransferase
VEKPPRDQAPTNEVNAGTYLLDPAVLELIPPGRSVSIERETFPLLISSGAKLFSYTTDDYWIDIGRPEHYHAIHRDVLDGILHLGPLADQASHRGRFHLPGDAVSHIGVIAPSFLGENVRLAEGAIVGPHAVLGDGVRIEANAAVLRSILLGKVVVEEGARIEGAIVASGVRIGAGAVVHSGAVIGHDAVIAPQAIVPPDARITAENSILGEGGGQVLGTGVG